MVKPPSEFYKDNRNNGVRSVCISCMKIYAAQNKTRIEATKKRWVKNNPEKRKASLKKYYDKPQIKIKISLRSHNIISEKNGFLPNGMFSIYDWETILKNQSNACACCGKIFTNERIPTVDCIIPLSKGGLMEPYNVQALCLSCNDIKRDLPIRFIIINGKKWWFKIPRFSKILQHTLI